MQDEAGKRRKKGRFGSLGLPVATRYPSLRPRHRLYLVGGVGALLIGTLFGLDASVRQGALISNGPLSSNHAGFGTDCASCHTPLQGVSDAKCGVCHEKFGDRLGTFSFDAHYLYRSGDFSRVVPAAGEVACATCHAEHTGAAAPLTDVPDSECSRCHNIDAFERDHPEFQFAEEALVDAANLHFPHTLHVSELQRREGLTDIEKTCLYCHNAEDDGKGFQPIRFEAHCDACHLSTSTATPFLNVASAPDAPGVATLEAIQAQQRPGTRWAYYTNPDEFQRNGNAVRKRPVYHNDPWILENLRRLRETLYPSNNLADLLTTSADIDPRNATVLYEEAIQTLRTYAEELRNQPDPTVQSELERVEELLRRAEANLQDPLSPRDETRFVVSAAGLNPAFSPEQVAAYEHLIDELTAPCQTCHLVEQATIKRVQTDQRTLIRSEFDHAAHIIQARCVDCHTEIPIQQFAATDSIPPPDLDRASIHNLPRLATCQNCHTETLASSTCMTCHAFHPNASSHRSNLLLYVE